LYWEISENEILMVMNKNARKRNAINEVANYFGLTLAETAAFGDDYNDIEMLRGSVKLDMKTGALPQTPEFIALGITG
jgi:hydroxymethylpyrimidine pyrophosphatase-like HAD family hydrolase